MLENLELLVSPLEVEKAYDKIANFLNSKFSDLNPIMIAVMNGGLKTTSELMIRCSFHLELESVRVTRYKDRISGGLLSWQATPSRSLKDRHVILVDDILDKGETLKAITEELNTRNPASITSAVLVKKILDEPAKFQADIAGLEVSDRFLVGEGMDLAGYGRNLQGIYALSANDELSMAKISEV